MSTDSPAAAATEGADDRYHKQSTSFDPEATAVVREWQAKTGKNFSETVCLLILAGVGNVRLLRHSTAGRLQALRFQEQLYRRLLPGPEHAEIHDDHKTSVDELERLLAPPDPT
jgi:hypothetical protein